VAHSETDPVALKELDRVLTHAAHRVGRCIQDALGARGDAAAMVQAELPVGWNCTVNVGTAGVGRQTHYLALPCENDQGALHDVAETLVVSSKVEVAVAQGSRHVRFAMPTAAL
jgi:hypothetical protein